MGFLAVLIKTISLCFVIHSCVSVFTNIKNTPPLHKAEEACFKML